MKESHGTQEVEVVAGRNVVVSAGIGKKCMLSEADKPYE